jgi:hypothetical protein
MVTVTAGNLTASVASATLAPVTYSDSPRTSAGVLTLSVSDRRGTFEGWSVSLSVSAFAYSGVSPTGTAIPASALAVTTANAPIVSFGQAVDPVSGPLVLSASATGPLDTPNVVLVAEPEFGAGQYTQTLDVALTIPAQSQVGTYMAVIEVVISAGP